MEGTGWGNVFGKFVEGYMRGSALATEQRQQKISGLMDMASKFANRADAEPDENMAKFFADQGRQMLDEASKMQTEKVGTWHLLSKLFGGGKGDKKLNAMAPGIMESTAKKPGADQVPQQMPVQQAPQTQEQAEEAFKGWTPGPGERIPQQAPWTAAGGEPPLTRYPTPGGLAPTIPSAWPTTTPPPSQWPTAVPTPSPGAAPIPRSIGGVPISRGEQREMTKSEFMAGRQEERQFTMAERQAHMAQQHNQEAFLWQAKQQDIYNLESAERWTGTDSAKQLQKTDPQLHQDIVQFKQFGIPIRDRSYQLKELDSKPDPITGKRTRQLTRIEVRTGEFSPIGPPEELPPSPHDLEVMPYMTGGKNYAEGEQAWANDQMSEVKLTSQIKQLSVERATETITSLQQLNKLRQQKLEGKPDAAWAKNFENFARPLAFQSGWIVDPITGEKRWDLNASMAAFIRMVQFYGEMDWPEFQKLRGKTDTGKSTTQDEDNATWFLNQHKNQQTNPQVGITGAIGGARGGPPAVGTPLTLPGGVKKQ